MENLLPPNASPEEVQAWHKMMDTMVTFIKASTELINTISRKVESKTQSRRGSVTPSEKDCEPECTSCKPGAPKPKCCLCGKPQPKARTSIPVPVQKARAASVSKEEPSVEKPPSEPEAQSEGSEFVVVESPPIETNSGSVYDDALTRLEEPPQEKGVLDQTITEESAPEEPEDKKEAPASDGTKEEAKQPSGDDGAAGEKCICAEIREKRKKKGRCLCGSKKPVQGKGCSCGQKSGQPVDPNVTCFCQPVPEPPKKPTSSFQKSCLCSPIPEVPEVPEKGEDACICEDKKKKPTDAKDEDEEDKETESKEEGTCYCPPTEQDRMRMVYDLEGKLGSARVEIDQLQEELRKLQRMDPNKKIGAHGGPNPAALYKEIMRGVPEPELPAPVQDDGYSGFQPPDASSLHGAEGGYMPCPKKTQKLIVCGEDPQLVEQSQQGGYATQLGPQMGATYNNPSYGMPSEGQRSQRGGPACEAVCSDDPQAFDDLGTTQYRQLPPRQQMGQTAGPRSQIGMPQQPDTTDFFMGQPRQPQSTRMQMGMTSDSTGYQLPGAGGSRQFGQQSQRGYGPNIQPCPAQQPQRGPVCGSPSMLSSSGRFGEASMNQPIASRAPMMGYPNTTMSSGGSRYLPDMSGGAPSVMQCPSRRGPATASSFRSTGRPAQPPANLANSAFLASPGRLRPSPNTIGLDRTSGYPSNRPPQPGTFRSLNSPSSSSCSCD